MTHASRTDQAILGLLQAAGDEGVGPLLKTVLHKFVYLIDLYEAEQSLGQTFSGSEWRFLHFGPFSPAVSERIQQLAGSGEIAHVGGTRSDDDAAYELYSLFRPAPTLKDFGSIRAYANTHRGRSEKVLS